MAYTDASTGWGLTPGAASENLSRMAGGGYGSMYGTNNSSPIYEQRMAQIRGNFAARQAQLGEERSRTENDRANTLAQQKWKSQNDQFEKDYLMRQGQYDQSQENWQKNWDFNQQKYEDSQEEAERERALSMYGSGGSGGSSGGYGGGYSGGINKTPSSMQEARMKNKWYEAMGLPQNAINEYNSWRDSLTAKINGYNQQNQNALAGNRY